MKRHTVLIAVFTCLSVTLGCARRVMGTTVIGGMLAATVLAIFLIPVTFYVVEKLSGAKAHNAKPAEPITPEPAPQHS